MVDYVGHEYLGVAVPRIDQYDDYCSKCWGEGSPEENGSES